MINGAGNRVTIVDGEVISATTIVCCERTGACPTPELCPFIDSEENSSDERQKLLA